MKKYLKIFLILIILLCLVILVEGIKISEISCRSQFSECPEVLRDKLAKIEDCDYFSCIKKINQVLSEEPLVGKYSYQFKLPLRISIDIIQKVPKYSLKSLNSDWVSLVDKDGYVLEIRESSDLPGVYFEKGVPSPGQKVEPSTLFALELVYGVSKLSEIENTNLETNLLSIKLRDGYNLIFPLEGDRDFLLGSVALILSRLKKEDQDFKIKNTQVSTIDLRFKNPVLK